MAPRDRPLAWFAAAFAVAVLAHGLWWRGLPEADLHGAVALLAAWVLTRPGARWPLAALAAGEALSSS